MQEKIGDGNEQSDTVGPRQGPCQDMAVDRYRPDHDRKNNRIGQRLSRTGIQRKLSPQAERHG